ncbi:restriction endonuclease subunit S [Acidithiobacillus sp.]|uniref:restriction endonuclease subunit S n=1 Tax=Acidithiobacillus sp. TaxID=1872118 RepID=UPI0025C6443C|nr:restriction endonuclease subunit S [Acidithiobacillus sp.]MCK9189173.1 restriction endonuclease subunit S [Acidithiobacillus sp.]MCK9359615.1 restriction endonuclease subunit S [Acidithiobacillus sp.]
MSERLPNGWVETTLGRVLVSVVGGGTPSRKVPAYFGGQIPWFTVKDMKALKPNDAEEHITEAAIADSATNLIPANTLIVATRIALGKAIRPTVVCAINQDLKALVLGSGINSDFLLHWVEANHRVIQDLGSGTTVSGIRLEALHGLPLLLPPSAEQTRIVAKLEELLSDLDAGVAELKAAQKKLAQYRQSLLKAAVEGALTSEWRATHTPLETGAQLRQRILTERRARWEAKQLAKFQQQGKAPPKDWQKKYPEPVQPDTSDLPELPQGWVWASLDMLGEIASGVAKGTKRDDAVEVRGVPYLRVANVQRGFLDLSEVKTILATERDIAELTLQAGDILFNEGGDRDKLGRGWVWRNEVESCIHQNHVFRMRLYLPEVLPELISHHGNTFGKTWFQSAGKQTTNLASINMTMLRVFPVPLGPADEQRELLNQLDVQIEQLDRQENAVEHALKQSTAQRQNILRAAFAGQLVPQDPNDEPASVLLERIRAERVEREKMPKIRKIRQKKEAAAMASKLRDVLAEAGDWVPAQEAFRRCGVADGAQTERIEELYAELRKLDKSDLLAVEAITDEQGRKLYDRLKLLEG